MVSSYSLTSKIDFLGFLKSQIFNSPPSSPVASVSSFKKYWILIASSCAFFIWIYNFPLLSITPILLSFDTVLKTFPSSEKIEDLHDSAWWVKLATSTTSSELY